MTAQLYEDSEREMIISSLGLYVESGIAKSISPPLLVGKNRNREEHLSIPMLSPIGRIRKMSKIQPRRPATCFQPHACAKMYSATSGWGYE